MSSSLAAQQATTPFADFPKANLIQGTHHLIPGGKKRFSEDAWSQAEQVVNALSGRSPDAVENVSRLTNLPLHPDTWKILAIWFCQPVDDRLQDLYGKTINAHPDPASLTQDARLALLDRVKPEATAIVKEYDWPWLARWLGLEEGEPLLLRHFSMGLYPFTWLVLRFSYHCNFRCAHCYNASGPERKGESLSLEAMEKVIRQMPANGLNQLTLTGGEPFMHADDLMAMIRIAREEGVENISIYTNAFWSEKPETLHRMLDRLEEAGFAPREKDRLKVSAGVHHAPFLEFGHILDLAKEYALRYGKKLSLDCELEKEEDRQRFEAQIAAAGAEEAVRVTYRPKQAHVGRGKALPAEPDPIHRYGRCYALNQLVVDPDGTIRPCCGMNYRNQGISVGSVLDEELSTLILRMQNDPLLQYISKQSMALLSDVLEKSPENLPDGNLCTLCDLLLADLKDREKPLAHLFPTQRWYPFPFHEVMENKEENHPEKEIREESAFDFSSSFSDNFPRILKALGISLAVTSYQGARLILLRTEDGETLDTRFKSFPRPMGIYADNERITLGTYNQVIDFLRSDELLKSIKEGALDNTGNFSRKVLEKDREEMERLREERRQELAEVKQADSLYLQRAALTTGMINIHDIAWGDEGLWVVNSTFSCLSTLSPVHSFVARWRPPFITELVPEDRCHVNGMALVDGKPRYATTFNRENRLDSWSEGRIDNGTLYDVETNEILAEGMIMPHSPRFYNGHVYVCESGLGVVWKIDPVTKEKTRVLKFQGFTRGITFYGDLMLVGTSRVRSGSLTNPIPIAKEYEETYAGVWMIDMNTMNQVGYVKFNGDIDQIYDVAVIPGSTMPELLGVGSVLTRHLFDFREEV